MIKPDQVTRYDRTTAELQEFLLFCIVVAGKNSHVQAKKLDQLLTSDLSVADECPFGKVQIWATKGELNERLVSVKMGQYSRLTKVFQDVADTIMDLSNVSVAILQNIVGMKTARFFLMHSRPGFRCATLDTHILKWLNEQGIVAPKATPSGNPKKYLELEGKYLAICDARGVSPAELDLEIWKSKRVA